MTQDELVQAINNHQKEVAVERGGKIGLTSVEAVVFAYNLALEHSMNALPDWEIIERGMISKLKIE